MSEINTLGISISRGDTHSDFQPIAEMVQANLGRYRIVGNSLLMLADGKNPMETTRTAKIATSLSCLIVGIANTEPRFRGLDAWQGSNELSLDGGKNYFRGQFLAVVTDRPQGFAPETESLVFDRLNTDLETLRSPISIPPINSSITI